MTEKRYIYCANIVKFWNLKGMSATVLQLLRKRSEPTARSLHFFATFEGHYVHTNLQHNRAAGRVWRLRQPGE